MPRVYPKPFDRRSFNAFLGSLTTELGSFTVGVTLKKYTREELNNFTLLCGLKINSLNATDPEANKDLIEQLNLMYQQASTALQARQYIEEQGEQERKGG
ncbi:hypothetical protein UCREL1_10285 [Eutypa lata UCREL1]|uniref:Uncharacterized protein n=1 Tax=Eutypa lata (strain UCR-EL1) TaxID=1287681 RepID=M7T803_EUTLA|nr:hypothetical protein UCREL1_10285 [Eutypa lata UCREL1]